MGKTIEKTINQNGYTLTELIVAITNLLVLVAITFALTGKIKQRAAAATTRQRCLISII